MCCIAAACQGIATTARSRTHTRAGERVEGEVDRDVELVAQGGRVHDQVLSVVRMM